MISARMSASDNAENTNVVKNVGVVKWFNNKAGFGFITMLDDGEHKNKDIFVHYSSIQVTNSQYKYLIKGEYVDFELVHTTTPGAEHEFYASAVSGIKGGLLMCETRRNEMANRPPAR
jgi:CspA family cold shock protein